VSPWIHWASRSNNYNNSPAIDMTRGVYLKMDKKGIIAIDIQDGYDKFNDNVKYFRQLSRPKHYYTKMSLLLIMKVKRKLRVMDCLKRFCSSTRPYRNRQNWNSLMYRSSRCFRDVFQQLTYSNGLDEKKRFNTQQC
jgi:hypothetical protein